MDGESGKRDGMGRAARHADPHWWRCMLECGKLVAENKPYFWVDDVKALCRARHPNAATHEYRASGPIMSALARLGYCERTPDFADSSQPQNHSCPRRVWRSLIYRGGPVKRPRRPKPVDPRQFQMRFEPLQ